MLLRAWNSRKGLGEEVFEPGCFGRANSAVYLGRENMVIVPFEDSERSLAKLAYVERQFTILVVVHSLDDR